MPLQNRVTPFGEIVATPERGMFIGNRGIIHDPRTRTLLTKRWSNPAWLICICDFRGRRRDVMARRSWTELFFLDEATALAAGHRPCFYCRRDDANRFRAAWCEGNRMANVPAQEIDAMLHGERLDGRVKRRYPAPCALSKLPDGAMIAAGDVAFVMTKGRALRWSFSGYGGASLGQDDIQLLTPPSTLRAIMAGYAPVLHGSAETVLPPP